jgi:ribosome-binding protein aMBF1 (putative translation factor)
MTRRELEMDKIDENLKVFAQRLVAARIRKGWGPRELAKQALTYSSLVSLYESGRRTPTASDLSALANALGVRQDDLWPPRTTT